MKPFWFAQPCRQIQLNLALRGSVRGFHACMSGRAQAPLTGGGGLSVLCRAKKKGRGPGRLSSPLFRLGGPRWTLPPGPILAKHRARAESCSAASRHQCTCQTCNAKRGTKVVPQKTQPKLTKPPKPLCCPHPTPHLIQRIENKQVSFSSLVSRVTWSGGFPSDTATFSFFFKEWWWWRE